MKLRKVLQFIFCCFLITALSSACRGQVKEPSVAGSFYPQDNKTLRSEVDILLSSAVSSRPEGKLVALVSPHAGYQFSGQVAAFAYNHLREREIKTVVIIGPSHHSSFNGVSVYAKGSFRTPLGDIKIDEDIAGRLINEKAHVTFFPDAFAKEHSIEVQLPFLQRTLKDFRIVPLLTGAPSRETFDHITARLTEILAKDDKVIIIASSDLSHFHDYGTAVSMDRKMTDAVTRMSPEDVERYLMSGEAEMCGAYPVIYTMAVARGLGATNGVLYKYANSGDVTGDRSRVVGYAAMGIYRSPLTNSEKEALLSLARRTITEYVTSGSTPGFEPSTPRLAANASTFVTINRNGNLRGCIGNIQPMMPLYRSVINNAVSASSLDRRFPPMATQELKDIEVEVSVLSPFEPLPDTGLIEIGRHGLYLVKDQRSSVFLPQVPVQFGWDRKTYLEQLALKAGLSKDSWKEAKLYTFTADVFK